MYMTEKDEHDNLGIDDMYKAEPGEAGLARSFQSQKRDPVMEVVMLLRQGVTPEELLAGGVPMKIIEQAMMILQAEMKKAETQQSGMEQGLASKLSGI